MCSHRLAIAKLVRDYKDPLFSPVSSQISRQNKQDLWEFIRQQAVAQGAVQYSRKSWKEIRDSVWAPIRRDTMAKVNKARTVGEDTVVYTEIDRVVLEIIGSMGTDPNGGEQDDSNANALGLTGQNKQQLDDGDNLNINALVAELAGDAVVAGGSDFKPNASTISQMIGGLDQFTAALKSGGGQMEQYQLQQQQISTNGGAKCSRGGENKGSKRRALDLDSISPLFVHPPPLCSSPFKGGNSLTESELDRETKQFRLEQIRLQNLLIQEQIEEKRLQNQMLRMELRKRQREEAASERI
uniref:Regulatory protein zeste n=1 Tax=Globodera rostochiensis TaxID=31243 RepID=A0A914HHY1_GLORO